MMIIKSYSELMRLTTFEERFNYLKLSGTVGAESFGFDRYLNQRFYKSKEWSLLRHKIIVRDNGCDLGVEGFDIYKPMIIHHMNPITVDDIKHSTSALLDPEFLILTSLKTHNAIHYGDDSILQDDIYRERSMHDTCLWKKR